MTQHAHVAIIGTGFGGLGMGISLRKHGIPFVIFEKAHDIGGTWRDNTYPGCQCDVPSHLYSFSFAPNPDWSRTYSPQREIWDYLRACTERYGLRRHIRLGHEVFDAAWEEDDKLWHIETSQGRWTAKFLVSANGGLSEPAIPRLPGLETFEGKYFHSARWDHSHDLSHRKVAVIGTGASAIQFVPQVQPMVKELHLYQRTPAWVLPHTDRPTTERERRIYRRFPIVQKAVRAAVYVARELLVFGLAKNTRLLRPLEVLGGRHLRDQVPDRALRKKLTPSFSAGCKRLLLSNTYLPAVSRPNVELVTDGIREVRPDAIVSGNGSERTVDTIIFGTGFKVTDNPVMDRLRGRDGQSLAKVWTETGLRAYLGTTVTGFPNLFLLSGPNTGIGHTSLLVMIEGQIRYITDCLRTVGRMGADVVEVRRDVMDSFDRELHGKMDKTVWNSGGCQSWYLDAQGRNTTLWPDFTWRFRLRTRRFDRDNYLLDPTAGPRRATASREVAR